VSWGAIVVAAGRGTRFGGPKQLVDISGKPMLWYSLRTFTSMAELGSLVVVTEPQWLDTVNELVAALHARCFTAVVRGGTTRQQSVRRGLDVTPATCDAVFVHDGARPLVRAEDVRAGMQEVRAGRGAVLGAKVVDTIKVVDTATMLVKQTLKRDELWAAQTPQFALREELVRAHEHAERAAIEATDDVALLEAIGIEVVVVPASGENFKVTHPTDVARAAVHLQ
jgi:2-C-methyl-D-erythritol 4-phosphate cytidylyltransferase